MDVIGLIDALNDLKENITSIDRMQNEVMQYFEHSAPPEGIFEAIRNEYSRIYDFCLIGEHLIFDCHSKVQNLVVALEDIHERRGEQISDIPTHIPIQIPNCIPHRTKNNENGG